MISEGVAKNLHFRNEIKTVSDGPARLMMGGKPFNAKEYEWVQRAQLRSWKTPSKDKEAPKTPKQLRYETHDTINKTKTRPAPRLDLVLFGALVKQEGVIEVKQDANNDFMIVLESCDGNHFKFESYTKEEITPNEAKIAYVIGSLNEAFGTNYYIDVSYPKEGVDVFRLKSGMVNEDGSPVQRESYLDFTAVRAAIQAEVNRFASFT